MVKVYQRTFLPMLEMYEILSEHDSSFSLLLIATQYVKGDLTKKFGLKESCQGKSTATSMDMKIILEQLWCHDSYTFIHERYRIQLALFVQILAYSASRPGAVVECSKYPNSNEALLYEARTPSCPQRENVRSLCAEFRVLNASCRILSCSCFLRKLADLQSLPYELIF